MDNGADSYRRFLNGDDNGIVEIIRDYKDGLILFLNRYVNNIHIAEDLNPGGRLVFAWDNPLMQCIDAQNGQYVLSRSYVNEQDVFVDESFRRHNWKLSAYLNCLANHGFLIEQVVEESEYDEKEADVFLEGRFYSAGKARLLNPSIIVKARKL